MDAVISSLRIRNPNKGAISDGQIICINPTPDARGIFTLDDTDLGPGKPVVVKSGALFRFPGDVQFVSIVYSGQAFVSTESDDRANFRTMTEVYYNKTTKTITSTSTGSSADMIGYVLDGGVRCDRILVSK
jgi:hypothetical protein